MSLQCAGFMNAQEFKLRKTFAAVYLQVRQPAFLFFAYQDLEGLVNDKVNN